MSFKKSSFQRWFLSLFDRCRPCRQVDKLAKTWCDIQFLTLMCGSSIAKKPFFTQTTDAIIVICIFNRYFSTVTELASGWCWCCDTTLCRILWEHNATERVFCDFFFSSTGFSTIIIMFVTKWSLFYWLCDLLHSFYSSIFTMIITI